MAIQKEIWQQSIVEGLFASNSFLSKAFNADEYVNAGKVVHIPQAGAPSAVVKDRSSFPAVMGVERAGISSCFGEFSDFMGEFKSESRDRSAFLIAVLKTAGRTET